MTAEIKAGPEPPPSPQSLGRKPAPGTHPGAFRQCHWIIREVANFTSYVRRVADPKHHTLGSIWMLSHDPTRYLITASGSDGWGVSTTHAGCQRRAGGATKHA